MTIANEMRIEDRVKGHLRERHVHAWWRKDLEDYVRLVDENPDNDRLRDAVKAYKGTLIPLGGVHVDFGEEDITYKFQDEDEVVIKRRHVSEVYEELGNALKEVGGSAYSEGEALLEDAAHIGRRTVIDWGRKGNDFAALYIGEIKDGRVVCQTTFGTKENLRKILKKNPELDPKLGYNVN